MYIEEVQTTQWPKEKGQKDKQRSTKHTHKTKDVQFEKNKIFLTIIICWIRCTFHAFLHKANDTIQQCKSICNVDIEISL